MGSKATRGRRRSKAAGASSSGDSGLKHGSEEVDKILPLDSLKLDTGDTLEDRPIRFLMPDSEEDREILMKVQSEEGKILKLKKEYMEASEKSLARVSMHVPPDLMALVKPASKKMKAKKVLLVKMLVPPEDIAYIKAMPCPVTSRLINVLSEDTVARLPEIQDYYRHKMDVNRKMRDYHQALVDQYDKFGYAVDEMELTDDEDEDEGEENALEN